MKRLSRRKSIIWAAQRLFFATATCACIESRALAEATLHPRLAWEQGLKIFEQSRVKTRQRRLTEALAALAQCRDHFLAIKKQWPAFRRRQIGRVLHEIHIEKIGVYRFVAEKGLVEYHGRFYSFEQMQQALDSQQQRTQKWLELLRAQEETRRARTERMVEDESKRLWEQDRRLREQDKRDALQKLLDTRRDQDRQGQKSE